jgi:hypothetical protein
MPRTIVHEKFARESLADGVWLDRLQPGGRRGPNGEVLAPLQGGQVWSDAFLIGGRGDAFQMLVPDIRLPANQIWPLHWHDCWLSIVILDGSCMVGDWIMQQGDVLISAAEVEYGPLVIGPDGCQLFEIFAQLHTSAGGYAPEYRDHPTLQGGTFAFKPRSDANLRNEGRMCLPVNSAPGLEKGRLTPGARWDLGAAEDADRGVMGYVELAPAERVVAHHYDDWHGLFVMRGEARVADRVLTKDDVLILEPGAQLDTWEAGPDGAALLEVARTAAGMDRRF